MALELVTPLPPGAPSHTRLAKHGVRLVVLREIKDGTDCSWPQPSANMVTLQEVGELQGKRHALFPWVPGVTLRDVVKALEAGGKPAPMGLAGRVLVDTARALAAIDPARAHGGIQDGAMQIGFDGKVSVLDFGAPRLSRFRPIGRVNFAADVFALGGVLHTVLTGFAGDYASPQVTLALPSNSHGEATPAIDDVVMRALSAQPDLRQADAATFADELEAVLGEAVYTPQQLAEVVSSLFKDRIKLLHSLGGLIEEQPSLEAVLPAPSAPMAPIPMGTQPGIGGPRPEPLSEPTLPRIALGDDPSERTDVRIPMPDAGGTSRSMLPWDSGEHLGPATEMAQAPLGGPRPSSPAVPVARVEPETNPGVSLPVREAEADTNPRAAAPSLPSDTDESSAPRPRASSPRPLGAENEHAVTRAGGPRALSRSDVEAARPRASSSRPAVSEVEAAKTAATSLPEDTNPRIAPTDDTNPRANRPSRLEDDVAATGPRPGPQPGPRNTTEAERYRAKGQERLTTPPAGSPSVSVDADHEDILNEPTAVRPRPDSRMTAQTSQTLEPAPPPDGSSGAGLRVVMVVLLVLVVGIAVAVVLKLKRQSEEPLPMDETVLEVDAGLEETLDAGDELVALIADLDGGDEEEEEEEEDELDGGEPDAGDVDAGVSVSDAGVTDGGEVKKAAPVKKPVKKGAKKKKRRR
ncbi:MAG: hypothetical protein Q8N23_25090 [Archangium sp.]|nr:hypothetical protein [Archangium sp.]MDP3155973.1 hypothetical protein [Archangium sp.]MDP3576131.1 hypothetical protein [Archangium sp.]